MTGFKAQFGLDQSTESLTYRELQARRELIRSRLQRRGRPRGRAHRPAPADEARIDDLAVPHRREARGYSEERPGPWPYLSAAEQSSATRKPTRRPAGRPAVNYRTRSLWSGVYRLDFAGYLAHHPLLATVVRWHIYDSMSATVGERRLPASQDSCGRWAPAYRLRLPNDGPLIAR